MKKVYLTMLMAAAAVSAANAQLYFVGNFNSFDLATAVEVQPNANGDYVFHQEGLMSFKFSTIKSTVWESDNNTGFNEGAYGINTNTTTMTEPGTYAIEPWAENQNLPWMGDWTVTVNKDLTQMTIATDTPKPEGEVFYLRGSWDAAWAALPEYQFQKVEGSKYVVKDVVFPGATKFKVADAGWATINYGGASNMQADQEYVLISGGGDCSMSGDGSFNGDVYFDLATATISFVKGAEPEIDKTLYIGYDGKAFDAETDPKFEQNGNEYTLTLPNGIQGSWYIWNGTWKYAFCPNNTINSLGTFDIWYGGFDLITYNTTNALTVKLVVPEGSDVAGTDIPAVLTLSEGSGVSEIAVEGASTEYYNLQGVRVPNPENGIYIVRQGNKVSKVVVK